MTAAPTPPALQLEAGALRLVLRPDLGAATAGFWYEGTPVLRSGDASVLTGPRSSGNFALAPYSNRIGYRHFRWAGRDHHTAENFEPGYPHSLHGTAWLAPWRVARRRLSTASLC